MAEGAQRVLGADVAISVTGVAGPDEMEGQPVGTVWYGDRGPGPRDRGGHRAAARSTASASASSRRSRCSTCCGCAARGVAVSPMAPGVRRGASRPSRARRRRRRRRRDRVLPRPARRWTTPDAVAPHAAVPRATASTSTRWPDSARARCAVPGGDVRLGGGGAFPSERRARVLWLGVDEGAELLAQLAGAVGALLAPLGYEPEDRPFHAHLTLARLGRPSDAPCGRRRARADPVGRAVDAPRRSLLLREHDPPRRRRVHGPDARFPLGYGWRLSAGCSGCLHPERVFG